jgi:epoxyqueuosine reductase
MIQNEKHETSLKMAQVIEREIKSFVLNSPLNRMPEDENQLIFDEPLVKFADGNDDLFNQFKSIIAPTHLTPREALVAIFHKNPDYIGKSISVISWILPIAVKTRKSNREQKTTPSRLWANTRWYGEKFNDALRDYVVNNLKVRGYMAVAPTKLPSLNKPSKDQIPYSNWSERHIAYVAGHGTFSLSDGFITEKGIAHRCGSVVIDLELPASVRTATSPYSNCLYYINKSCKACVARCPGNAITENGHDKVKCLNYTHTFKQLREDWQMASFGCGLCQTKVPCESINPTKKLR